MRKLVGLLSALFFLLLISRETAVTAPAPPNDDQFTYLPLIANPNLLPNYSFEDGWIDLPPVGNLTNQQPNHWLLSWVEPGEPLYDSTDLAGGVPECVHKLNWQLPPDEQRGGPHALILDGEATYKMFHATAPFGAELRQTVSNLQPGAVLRLTVPMQVHLHDDLDPFAAEGGVWVNGIGNWVNGGTMGDRQWYKHIVTFTVPSDGLAEVVIRVKSKWAQPKDFFVDYLQLEAATSLQGSEITGRTRVDFVLNDDSYFPGK